jgi:hypothetical protein
MSPLKSPSAPPTPGRTITCFGSEVAATFKEKERGQTHPDVQRVNISPLTVNNSLM